MGTGTEPPLETGWRPDTPRQDTLVRTAVLAHADGYEHVAATRGGRAVRRNGLSLSDTGSANPFFNVAFLLEPALGPEFVTVQDEVERFFGARPGGGVVLFSPWPTPLEPRPGWELLGHPPLM